MPSLRDLRRRIRSIKNTSQITKAMQMVSATKMRRAQNQAVSGRPYRNILSLALALSAGKIDPTLHPLLLPNGSKNIGVVLLSTDKGLCGSLNTNLFRLIQSHPILENRKAETVFYTVGKKGRDFIARTNRQLEADYQNPEKVSFNEGSQVRKMIVPSYLSGEVGEVYLGYVDFVSTLRQEAKLVKVLPIDPETLRQAVVEAGSENAQEKVSSEFLFEPSATAVLDYALVHLIDTQIYQALLETKASEHSARMIAMQNATNNAKDLVSDLSLTYNQLRQDAITKELLEISSAAAALE